MKTYFSAETTASRVRRRRSRRQQMKLPEVSDQHYVACVFSLSPAATPCRHASLDEKAV
jgi:hypothetical protein